MTTLQIKKVGIVGAGLMGTGIAQLFASKGFQVLLSDVDLRICERSRSIIAKNFQKQLEKGRCSAADIESWMSSITISQDLSALGDADIVIEAIIEDEAKKHATFKALDLVMKQDAILASNTSSISITGLGTVTARPDKVIGMHFMNPAPVMSGVEVVKGLTTSDETVNIITSLVGRLDKIAILVNDKPGFVVNRILFPMLNEAMFALYEGVSTRESIDNGMKLCCNLPIGPLALADMIGLDTVLAILNTLHVGFGDDKYKPCPLLKECFDQGQLGKKTGKGFFEYSVK